MLAVGTVVAVLVGLAGAGPLGALLDTGPSDAELRSRALDEAITRTLDGRLAFSLSVDADEGDLAGFGDAAGPLAALLAGSAAAGVIEEDRLAIGLSLGGVDVVQARVVGPGEQYVRADLGALAEFGGASAEGLDDDLEEALAGTDVTPDVRAAVRAAGRGEWVRLLADPSDDPGDDPGEGPGAGSSLAGALEAVLRSADAVDHDGDLERLPFDGRLVLRLDVERAVALVTGALVGLDEDAIAEDVDDAAMTVAARALVDDGVIRTLVVELAPRGTAASGAATTAPLEVRLELRPLADGAPLVAAPEAVAEVTPAELERALAALGRLAPGAAP